MSDLPQGWEWATLEDVAIWGSGGTPKAGRKEFYGGEIPWAVIGDLTDSIVPVTRGSLTTAGLEQSSAKLVPAGSVLIAMYGSIGKLGLNSIELATNQAIAFAQPLLVDTKYLFWYLMATRAQLTQAGKGATQQNISQTILRSWPIPVAPAGEQRRIVAALEDHLSRLIAGSEYVNQSSSRLASLHTSALTQYYENSKRGGAPLIAVGELAETQLGKMIDAKKVKGEPTRYLRNINVRWHSFDLADLAHVALTDAERTKFDLRNGDVLVCEGGEPGRSAVWHGQMAGIAFQKALHRVRVRDGIRPEWLCMMLEAEVRSGRVAPLLTGSTIKHLPQEKLRAIEIPVPQVDLQTSSIREFSSLLTGVARMKDQSSVLVRSAETLRRSLLAEAFAGRLVPQDPDDEPASVLLDRIRTERAAQPKPRRTRKAAAQ